MLFLKKFILPFFFNLWFVSAAYCYMPPQPFWSNQIDSALTFRDNYFSSIGIAQDGLRINSWNNKRRKEVRDFLEINHSPENPWYNFIKGMLQIADNAKPKERYLKKALSLCENSPGITWVLFIEFTRYQQHIWAENCLVQLEKQMFIAGARSVPVISQQLTHFAVLTEKSNPGMATNYFKWAEKFDIYQNWPTLHQFWTSLPFKPVKFTSSLRKYSSGLINSWNNQLFLFQNLYFWIRGTLILFTIVIFSILFAKYFPKTLHKTADLFPLNVHPSLRTSLAIATFCSLSAFGIIPFIWISIFLTRKYLLSKEKILAAVCLILVSLAPLDVRILDIFNQIQNPNNSPTLFLRSINEGYSPELHRALYLKTRNNQSDYLAQTASAVSFIKKNDLLGAHKAIQEALRVKPDDPVSTTCAGNIFYLGGNTKRAKDYFNKALASGSQNVSTKFNLAQCHFREKKTIAATNLIREAAKIEPAQVNSYIEKNDSYFSKKWPKLRTLMFPDYTPEYFWKNVAKTYAGDWKSASNLWGTRFLGIPPVQSILLSFILLIIFISQHFKKFNNKIKTIYECRYCGRAICSNCKTGMLCSSCNKQTQLIKNEITRQKYHLQISQRTMRIKFVRDCILDILFPGAGKLMGSKGSFILAILIILFTSLVYNSYNILITRVTGYFSSIDLQAGSLFVLLFAYNLFFACNKLSSLLKKMHSK